MINHNFGLLLDLTALDQASRRNLCDVSDSVETAKKLHIHEVNLIIEVPDFCFFFSMIISYR